jgi:hypothetical protein
VTPTERIAMHDPSTSRWPTASDSHHEPMATDQPQPDPEWERRVACAEINRRRVNEAIEQGRKDDAAQVFMCECGRVGCNTTLTLTLTEYEAVRTDFDRFVVVPGHEVEAVDQVVERHAAHRVVTKRGAEAREIARETDERRDADEVR